MEKVRSEQPVSSFRTLFLGLLDTQPGLPLRLALLAKRSPQWDSHLGRPKQGPLDRLVVQLANESTLFEEWQQLFHRFGLRIRVSGVESVSVAEAGKLPFFGEWQKHGIQAADRVPYNGLVWFAVTQEAL